MPTKVTQSKTSSTKRDAANFKVSPKTIPIKQPVVISATESNGQRSLRIPAGRIKNLYVDLFSLQLDRAKVEELAYLTSLEGKSWDEYIWRLAELEMQVGPACGGTKNVFTCGGLPDRVLLHPAKVVQHPRDIDVQQLAYEISQRGPNIQDLHWFIAQRQYIQAQIPNLK